MNEKDYLKILSDDTCLSDAVRSSEEKQPPLPSGLNERLMRRLDERKKPRRRVWPFAATVFGIAASVLLALMLRPTTEQTTQPPVIADLPQEAPPQPAVPAEPIQPIKPNKPTNPIKPKRLAAAELPDTLGESIFESEENVMRTALMLYECEVTIRQEEQQLHNHIIEATFNALPQAENSLLVTNENGDFEVIQVSEDNTIEI